MTEYENLERYRGTLFEDFDAFEEAIARPLPRCVWTNPLRTTPQEVAERLEARGVVLKPVGWHPWAFLAPEEFSVGSTLEYALGLYHVQEEVALTAGVALGAQPGERILDLCAAPGNKTIHAAMQMRNEGMIVANDSKQGRLSGLRYNLERMGVLNTVVTCLNGSGFPLDAGPFDRVMADVPCSCEGTARRSLGANKAVGFEVRQRLARTQGHLLTRALKLTRPGGVVVYATCTFAPEENEGVLTEAIGDRGRIVPFELPGLVSRPGILHWRGVDHRPDVVHARRFVPQDNDTGGFFVARIEVTG